MIYYSLLLIFFSSFFVPSQFELCGKTKYSSGLIVNGDEVKRGEFPFLVALFRLKDQKFFCAGNLITKKHVLTASHCIQEKSQSSRLQPEDILAQIGKYNLKAIYEKGSVAKEIIEIIMHDDWKPYITRYDADIALLILESQVELSEFIQIVCLPSSWQSNDLIEGEVVGYGVSEKTDFTEPEDTPKKAKLKKPPTNENCFLQDSILTSISSNRTFCAGGENKGVCSGDSGGGFYIQRESTWYLQGIVSSSLINEQRRCDVTTYAVFTNIAIYVNWIWEKVDGLTSIDLPCEYDFSDTLRGNPYFCEANIKVLTDNILIKRVIGSHKAGKQNTDVKLLDLSPDDDEPKREIHFMPSGISDIFPNLRILYIQSCQIKTISRKNFKRFNELTTISLTENQIEHIDEDTFYEVPNLYSLRINGNRLKNVPDNLFIYAPRLQHFIFDGNLIEQFEGDRLFRNNPLLKSIVLEDNQLSKIKINLAAFKELVKVNFENNKCINARVGTGSTKTLTELQEIINTSC
ncbi:hypothetical protein PVAND_000455 [Polypedilum vanderplanki]|uniref:Peptidase S1 domain-containing protein n=1 Tax=Polypedilum vanderplanki TaxID=319348 RepID=A0A9J6BLC0_POLVA|nr:hypothetical protein PVAND_000455 [Polypedilum vanderplanki]